VSGCCPGGVYGEFFDEKLAHRDAERYRRKGLGGASRRLVELVEGRGIAGASVLEIGGGTGTLQIELLERGAERSTNLELSPGYEREARRLLEERGLRGRVDRRVVDVVAEPDAVEGADLVLLHRVVCCYHDYEALLATAAEKARRVVAFSFPPDQAVARLAVGLLNLGQRLRGSAFRSFVHPERAMLDAVVSNGFRVTELKRAGVWRLALLERVA
jgi:magnesium-protoporphyrin O-methyltransferase